jgi:hypothetical protein
MPTSRLTAVSLGLLMILGTGTALAQGSRTFTACQSQEALSQVIKSKGEFVPDGCRTVTVSTIAAQPEDLCVLDFAAQQDRGVIDRLTEAALPTQWWIACSELR